VAILDTTGATFPTTTALVIAVAVTSLRCWLAQEYAQIPGEQAQGVVCRAGHPSGSTGRILADGHRVLPAAARTGAGQAGRDLRPHGRNVGLVVAIVLLTVHRWVKGTNSP
jgi:hypothetical protein